MGPVGYEISMRIADRQYDDLGTRSRPHENAPEPSWGLRGTLSARWRRTAARAVWVAFLFAGLACAVGAPAAPPGPVPPTFEPIRVVSSSPPILELWGRRYEFATGPLPHEVMSQGQPLFAAPPQVLLDEVPVEWTPSEIIEATPTHVLLRSRRLGGKTPIEAETRVEYDGMLLVSLRVGGEEARFIRGLRYRFDLPREVAQYFNHHLPYDYRNFNIKKASLTDAAGRLEDGHRRLYFVPSLSLGNRRTSLEWWIETNAHFHGPKALHPLEWEANDELVRLEITPVSARLALGAGEVFEDRFAIFPGPLRPPMPGWRSVRYVSQGTAMPRFDEDIATRFVWVNHSSVDPPRWHGLPHGRQTADHTRYRRALKLRDIDYVPYGKLTLAPNLHPRVLESFEAWSADGQWYRTASEEEKIVFRASGDSWEKGDPYSYGVCMGQRSYLDWMLRENVAAVRAEKLDGVYFDHGAITRMCRRSPILEGHPKREIWEYLEVRRFYKALYEQLKAIDPEILIMIHSHGAPRALGAFVDFHLIGESLNGAFTRASHFREVLKDRSLYEPDYLAYQEWLSAQFFPVPGGISMLLPQIRHGYDPKDPKRMLPYQRAMFSWLLAEDVPVYFGILDVPAGTAVLNAVDQFGGMHDATVVGWWEGDGAITTTTPGLRVTYYQKPDKVLAVVANWSGQAAHTKLVIDSMALGLGHRPSIRDAEAQTPAVNEPSLPLRVPARDFRLLLIEE